MTVDPRGRLPSLGKMPEVRITTSEKETIRIETWHVEVDPAEIQRTITSPDVSVVRATEAVPEVSKFFYDEIGTGRFWWERASWDLDQWQTWLARANVRTSFALVGGAPVGFAECELQASSVEILLVGVLEGFRRRGAAEALIFACADLAMELGAQRMWGRTSSLDHPSALAFYLSLGARVFDTTVQEIPQEVLGELAPDVRTAPNE